MQTIKIIIWSSIMSVLRAIDYLVPKDPSIIILCTDHPGNTIPIYNYIRTHNCGLQAYSFNRWGVENPDDPNEITHLFRLGSLWNIFRAKTIVSTHTTPLPLSQRKIYVETWHGVALKGMMYTEIVPVPGHLSRTVRRKWTKYVDLFVVPSREAAYRISACFLLNQQTVFYCGQARNDVLYKEKRDLEKIRTRLNLPDCEKLILYCPTFWDDGTDPFFPFNDMDFNDLEHFLEEQKAVLLLRAHYNDPWIKPGKLNSRIVLATVDIWQEVNELLPHIDLLITDYSSIYSDYLILDRPIIFAPGDIQRYKGSRGLLVDDYDWWTPGDKVFDFASFKSSIMEGLKNPDVNKEKREMIHKLINYHQDGDSCPKIVEKIKEQIGNANFPKH